MLFWTQVLAASDPGLAPATATGQQLQPEAPCRMRTATANVLNLRPREEKDGVDSSARRIMMEEQFAEAGLHFVGIQ